MSVDYRRTRHKFSPIKKKDLAPQLRIQGKAIPIYMLNKICEESHMDELRHQCPPILDQRGAEYEQNHYYGRHYGGNTRKQTQNKKHSQ